NWRRSFTAYGLGPLGPFFWILGAPMGKATNTVAMDLQLTPANEPSRAMWQFSMEFEDNHLFGIYYGMEQSVENYANAVQETLKAAISNLVKIATEHPELLRPGSAAGVSTAQSHEWFRNKEDAMKQPTMLRVVVSITACLVLVSPYVFAAGDQELSKTAPIVRIMQSGDSLELVFHEDSGTPIKETIPIHR